MVAVGQVQTSWPQNVAIFGASGAIGAALCHALSRRVAGHVYAGSRGATDHDDSSIIPFRFDLLDEGSIVDAAKLMRATPPDLVIVASGALTLESGAGPEKSFRQIDGDVMAQVLALNTIGPALVAKHMLPLLPRSDRGVFAAMSARVGSISDNRLGGWHSYRASKAALNMLIRNFAIEIGRTHNQAVVVGLHPGTVDSALSAPFQSNLPDGQLMSATTAAANLLAVIDRVSPEESGKVFDWRGEEVPA